MRRYPRHRQGDRAQSVTGAAGLEGQELQGRDDAAISTGFPDQLLGQGKGSKARGEGQTETQPQGWGPGIGMGPRTELENEIKKLVAGKQ